MVHGSNQPAGYIQKKVRKNACRKVLKGVATVSAMLAAMVERYVRQQERHEIIKKCIIVTERVRYTMGILYFLFLMIQSCAAELNF